jgi:TRAP-type C4-dicarboxylate transport system permease small subunit
MKKILRNISWAAAVLGGVMALAVAVMTVYSITQRFLTSRPLQGDIELVQLGIAISISLCIAWCQLHGGNIIVDFFTQNVRPSLNRFFDALGCLMLAIMYGLLSVRTVYGAFAVHASYERTATLDLPGWWTYAWLAPGLALGAVIALTQAWMHFTQQDMTTLSGEHIEESVGAIQ